MRQKAAARPKVMTEPERRQAEVDAQRRANAAERQKAEALRLVERGLKIHAARKNLIDYVQFTTPDPEAPNDHDRTTYEAKAFHRACAAALERVERGEIQQLIFCMPPRHGKTKLATVSFGSWLFGKHPTWNIAVGTYSDQMANDFGADTRAIIQADPFKQLFPAFELRRGGSARDNMNTVNGGRMVFVGRGGALTGKGAHALLLDDLYKDYEEARSQAIRNQAWDWFTKVAMTRRMGPKLVVITMTRWHSDDIIGRLTDPENPFYNAIEAAKWKIIRLPAIAEDDDDLGRAPGEALWPERFDVEFLQSQQRLDPLGFASLYQQRPTVADGVLFRRETIQRYRREQLPADLRYYCASDHAVATGQRNDPSCFVKVGIDRQDNIWVVDCFWRKVPTDQAVEAMLTMGGGSTRPVVWWAEKGHISQSIGPFLNKRMQETGTYINVREVTPVADKQTRAQSIAARCAAGKVYIPTDTSWGERAVDEMLAFPNGTHDDFVDALAHVGNGLTTLVAPSAPVSRRVEPRFGTLGWAKIQNRWQEQQKRALQTGGL